MTLTGPSGIPESWGWQRLRTAPPAALVWLLTGGPSAKRATTGSPGGAAATTTTTQRPGRTVRGENDTSAVAPGVGTSSGGMSGGGVGAVVTVVVGCATFPPVVVVMLGGRVVLVVVVGGGGGHGSMKTTARAGGRTAMTDVLGRVAMIGTVAPVKGTSTVVVNLPSWSTATDCDDGVSELPKGSTSSGIWLPGVKPEPDTCTGPAVVRHGGLAEICTGQGLLRTVTSVAALTSPPCCFPMIRNDAVAVMVAVNEKLPGRWRTGLVRAVAVPRGATTPAVFCSRITGPGTQLAPRITTREATPAVMQVGAAEMAGPAVACWGTAASTCSGAGTTETSTAATHTATRRASLPEADAGSRGGTGRSVRTSAAGRRSTPAPGDGREGRMDHVATITPSGPILPGQSATLGLTIHNASSVVERYDIRVLGDAADWFEPVPSVVVYPGQEQHVFLTVHVPERALAGEVPVGVLVSAQEAATQLTEETALGVSPTRGLDSALVPMLSHGRRHGVHTFAVINRGNTPINVGCAGAGDDVDVSLTRDEAPIDAFGQVEVGVRVSHMRRQWLRKAGPSPFTVTATSDSGDASIANGSHEAASRIPRWTPLAVVAALALLLALFAFSGAQDAKSIAGRAEETAQAAETPISEQAKAINDLAAAQGKPPPLPAGSPGNPGQLGPDDGGSGSGSGNGSGSGSGSGSGNGSDANASGLVGDPFDRRFEPGSGIDEFEVPSGKLLGITDIVFENAGGDQGRLTLSRNGTVLLRADLAGFRDQDTHLVTPLRFKAGDKLTVAVTCTAPGPGAPACSAAALVSGVLADD